MHRTQKLAITALMASLALAFSVLKLEAPYPMLPYLKFDLAEIPVTTLYFLCGISWSLVAETLHFVGLLARGADPLGAMMKYLAVVSMLVGTWLTGKVLRKNIIAQATGGAMLRIFVMLAANWAYFSFLYPNLLSYAVKQAGGVFLLYLYTSLFNLIHAGISLGISWILYAEINKRIKL
ncbi:MAG: hypothetical protein ABWK01_04160 [Infirmifilum sp.]